METVTNQNVDDDTVDDAFKEKPESLVFSENSSVLLR